MIFSWNLVKAESKMEKQKRIGSYTTHSSENVYRYGTDCDPRVSAHEPWCQNLIVSISILDSVLLDTEYPKNNLQIQTLCIVFKCLISIVLLRKFGNIRHAFVEEWSV